MNPISAPRGASTDQLLRFSIPEGLVSNEFLRQGPVAAHLLLTSGSESRLLAAFPAGNSAIGVWFTPGTTPVHWGAVQQMRSVRSRDARGNTLYGFEAEIDTDVTSLTVSAAVLSSARVLRDYQLDRRLPAGIDNTIVLSPDTASWSRDRLDGAPGYAIVLQAVGGSVATETQGRLTLSAIPGQRLRLHITALCGETPLAPLDLNRLLRQPDSGSLLKRQSLAFLSYEDKLLAGSWRFNTYFGRDTLMSLLLLMPVLTPVAIEAGLGAVLSRLDANGDVAHEEGIGEYALLYGDGKSAVIYDYKMVDDDFMLAPVMAAYLLDQPEGRTRAAHFLAQRSVGGQVFGEAFCKNLQLVQHHVAAFAERPAIDTLIHFKPGQVTGDWRDSTDGLGRGTVSYNVNAVLVPAALRAILALAESGLLAPYTSLSATKAATQAQAWEACAANFFLVERDPPTARRAVATYASEVGVDPSRALVSLNDQPVRFSAIALDAAGAPVPVLHSDFGFALLLLRPVPSVIERELAAIMRPFPAGLMTEIGLLVANAAYADSPLRAMFGPDRYHGAVVWSWQQALLAAGLARQLERADLPVSTRQMLASAQSSLWTAIKLTQELANSELWSWAWVDDAYQVRPFGPGCATADESNAAQLWSTVYLAVKPPRANPLSPEATLEH
jgi:hypothetical protein